MLGGMPPLQWSRASILIISIACAAINSSIHGVALRLGVNQDAGWLTALCTFPSGPLLHACGCNLWLALCGFNHDGPDTFSSVALCVWGCDFCVCGLNQEGPGMLLAFLQTVDWDRL